MISGVMISGVINSSELNKVSLAATGRAEEEG
jgi:hypothetical protein